MLKSWEEVNESMKEMGYCQIALENAEADMQLRINQAKEDAEVIGKPLKNKIKELEKEISIFAEEHKDEIEGKTKELHFGKVGFRLRTSISIPTKKLESVIQKLKKLGMENCIKITENVNKDVLATYSEKEIAKVGAVRKTEDKFWCEIDRQKIKGS